MDQVTSPGPRSSAQGDQFRIEISPIASWILGFGLVLFAATSDGAFDLRLFGQIGTFAWLLLALGLLIGLFPIDRPGPTSWLGLSLWLGLIAWAALGLLWTDSPDKTWVEVARLATYAGVFALALMSRGDRSPGNQVGSVAAGVTVVAAVALISRFQPDLWPSAHETGRTLTSEAARLSFPLDYWNGLAALVAIGLAPLIEVAGGARRLAFRALATAALPICLLVIYFTFSRGGILAAGLAVLAYFCLASNRLARLLPAALGLCGGLVLILLARSKSSLNDGLTNSVAQSQGDTMMLLSIATCVLVAVAAFLLLDRVGDLSPPARFRPGRRQLAIGAGAVALVAILILLLAGVPGRISNGWESFKSPEAPTSGSSRLEAANGNGRYQYWSSAAKQWKEAPVQGHGAGTFEFWWAENGDRTGFIRDTHSLYFQTLGESGLIGLLLLLGLFGLVIVVGCREATVKVLDRRGPRAGWLAAATAGCLAFMISAGLDWSWQLPAVVLPFLLLSATILGQTAKEASFGLGARVGLAAAPLVAVVLIAIPLTSALWLERSQESASAGNLTEALDAARSAHAISPSTAAPLLQEAGLLEQLDDPTTAMEAAREATRKEPVNWRNWLVLSLIEARHGSAEQALEDFHEAQRLNPRSPLFTTPGTD
ncbi:MAG: tetratricopeptide repeat protein [Solirubrobacterales bacterium]|nr:tetratricopeptide repeat protein [Solirubrobacterales bacterium]OJU96171.1 MAG: hypothetical protein BGO23_01215 [Solirubrobacterales bacterium 67-14]